ncbi:sensor histidine kinase [Devosia sp.]|uniref:sensor histidine kinase n=1 Tax=Devosia sp. TaxID=1871048 RepID=UPI002FCAF7C8
MHQDADHRFDLVENPPPDWPDQNLIGRREADILPPDIATQFAAAHDHVRDSGEEQLIEFSLGEGLRRRLFEARLLPDEEGAIAVIADITDTRARELAVASLLREVSHRSKNLLAIVQSVAMQTAHHSGDIQDFLNKFRGRLHALSSTQDLVTESNWRGTYLQTLVTSQLTRVGSALLAEVRVTGENPLLGPNASLHIGLAIHELGANAVLHGALANGKPGHVWVDAQIVAHPGQEADLVIEWQEAGIDTDKTVHEPRFGTLVLERIVPLSVGGTAEFSIEPDSVRYRLVVPADQFEA